MKLPVLTPLSGVSDSTGCVYVTTFDLSQGPDSRIRQVPGRWMQKFPEKLIKISSLLHTSGGTSRILLTQPLNLPTYSDKILIMKQHPLLSRLRGHALHRTARSKCRPRQLFVAALLLAVGMALGASACSPATTEQTEQVGTADSTQAPAAGGAKAGAGTKVYVKDGVAIAGADPVAYFTDEQFVAGSTEYTHEWQGTTWQFANAENRDRFASDPEAYAPQYGGYCAWAVGQNALAAIDPNAWSIVDGKLYLNANERIQTRWSEDIPGNIALAEANWPTLSQ